MLALYRATDLLSYWVAYSDRFGWVTFPARPNGWSVRKPYNGDTAKLMRIPARLGFNTGFPHPEAAPAYALHESVFDEIAGRVRRRVA